MVGVVQAAAIHHRKTDGAFHAILHAGTIDHAVLEPFFVILSVHTGPGGQIVAEALDLIADNRKMLHVARGHVVHFLHRVILPFLAKSFAIDLSLGGHFDCDRVLAELETKHLQTSLYR